MLINSPSGDALEVAIDRSGIATIRATGDIEGEFSTLVVDGFSLVEAKKKGDGFWGRLWDWAKGVGKAVADAVTFDVAGASCRPDVTNVQIKNGQLSGIVVGIKCEN